MNIVSVTFLDTHTLKTADVFFCYYLFLVCAAHVVLCFACQHGVLRGQPSLLWSSMSSMHLLIFASCVNNCSGMLALAMGCPSLKHLWVQACQVELQGVRMLAKRPGLTVEVVKESCNDDGPSTPWQLIAYGSVAPPRDDLPDNIDHVHDGYNTPLNSELFCCPSTVTEAGEAGQGNQ